MIEADLEDRDAVENVFAMHKPLKVVNLAAQAGVRYSIENPAAYIQSNLVGFGHILEGYRHHGVENLRMPLVVRCMVATQTCRFQNITALITP